MSQARCISQGDNGEAVLGTTRSFAKQSHNPRPKHFADRCNPCVKQNLYVYIYIFPTNPKSYMVVSVFFPISPI